MSEKHGVWFTNWDGRMICSELCPSTGMEMDQQNQQVSLASPES